MGKGLKEMQDTKFIDDVRFFPPLYIPSNTYVLDIPVSMCKPHDDLWGYRIFS
jgi:hypothetical protein